VATGENLQIQAQFLDSKALASIESRRITKSKGYLFSVDCEFKTVWLKVTVDARNVKVYLRQFNIDGLKHEKLGLAGSTTLLATTEEMVSTSIV
jgi:hypothetical protein